MKTQDSQLQEINRLLSSYDKKFARAFLTGIAYISDQIVLKQIADRLRVGDISGVMAIFNEALVASGMVVFARTLQSAMIEGGDYASRIAAASKVEFGFNVAENKTSVFLRGYQAEWIKQITAEMRKTVSQIIYREVSAGTNPIETARKIRNGLGLTAYQENVVENYRKYLEDLDARALENRLRDARFDPTVARAMQEGRPLTKAQIDKIVNRYRERYILRRSETIARTESMTMLHSGENQYWNQLVDSRQVLAEDIKRKWIVTRDSRLRHSHAAIPSLNKEGRGLNEPFRSPLGMIRYPGDPAASAANRINCRCAIFTRIEKE